MPRVSPNQISFVIPTKDRPNEVRTLLESIRNSTVRPGEIIFVYAGQDITSVLAEFSDLPVKSARGMAPSQIKQRNQGIEMVNSAITYVACFDDDITLEPDALAHMLEFVNRAEKDYAAVAFNIVNTRGFRFNVFKWLFGMAGFRAGELMPSGYNTNLCNVSQSMDVDWVFGGATLWKKSVLSAKREDHYGTYAFIEDVEFSHQVKREHPLAVCADAKVHDLRAAGNFHKTVAFGRMQVTYRIAFVKRAGDLSLAWAYWSCVGQTLENFVRIFLNRNPHLFKTVWGNILGLLDSVLLFTASPSREVDRR